MGSSFWMRAAGLTTGRKVPSSARYSWTTLRGNGNARSPASRLGSICHLHRLDKFGHGGGVSHSNSSAVSPREGTEEPVDDYVLRDLARGGFPIQ